MELRVGDSGRVPEFIRKEDEGLTVHPLHEPTPPNRIQMHPGPVNLDQYKYNPILQLTGEDLLNKAMFYFD